MDRYVYRIRRRKLCMYRRGHQENVGVQIRSSEVHAHIPMKYLSSKVHEGEVNKQNMTYTKYAMNKIRHTLVNSLV